MRTMPPVPGVVEHVVSFDYEMAGFRLRVLPYSETYWLAIIPDVFRLYDGPPSQGATLAFAARSRQEAVTEAREYVKGKLTLMGCTLADWSMPS